jgi:hypothetical protein
MGHLHHNHHHHPTTTPEMKTLLTILKAIEIPAANPYIFMVVLLQAIYAIH